MGCALNLVPLIFLRRLILELQFRTRVKMWVFQVSLSSNQSSKYLAESDFGMGLLLRVRVRERLQLLILQKCKAQVFVVKN